MQGDPRFFTGKASSPHAFEAGGYTHNNPVGGHYNYGAPVAPAFDAALVGRRREFPGPLNGVEFQPSETCPKNFIIFDQTDDRSRVMFHPALANKFSRTSFNICPTYDHEYGGSPDEIKDCPEKSSSYPKEDTEDINALLSSEEEGEEEEDEDDDVVSTGRTPGNCGGRSPDSSCSTDGSNSRTPKLARTSYSAGSSDMKKEKMRKMVKALRGIIPGGDQMDTPVILDEAVRYLKSLKMEVKKLGIQNFKN